MFWMRSPWLAPPELLNWPLTLLLPQGEASLLGSDDCNTITHCLRAPSPEPHPIPKPWWRSPAEVQPGKIIYKSAFKYSLSSFFFPLPTFQPQLATWEAPCPGTHPAPR